MEVPARLEDEPPEHAVPVEFKPRGYVNGASLHIEGLPDYPTEEQIEALLENHPHVREIWDQTTALPADRHQPERLGPELRQHARRARLPARARGELSPGVPRAPFSRER